MPRPPATTKNTTRRKDEAQPTSDKITPESPTAPIRRSPARQNQDGVRVMQPQLFGTNNKGDLLRPAVDIPPLTYNSPFDVGRFWFRNHLETLNRPKNTIASYMYDLAGFEEYTGVKPVDKITASDIAAFLAQSQKKSTRKRRLTSLGAFFKYLIQTEKMADKDPTDNFYADFIPLKTPIVLDQAEQKTLLEVAERENVRTYLMIFFMLRLGFNRTELLAVQPEHVDISDPQNPQVYIAYEDKRWVKKERKLAAVPEFTPAYQRYIAEFKPSPKLFEMLPQSVNKLVERVTRNAEINKRVTPQSLRDTFAVEEARSGANTIDLLKILGLAPDPRNRMSVDRYVKLAMSA